MKNLEQNVYMSKSNVSIEKVINNPLNVVILLDDSWMPQRIYQYKTNLNTTHCQFSAICERSIVLKYWKDQRRPNIFVF